MIGCCHSNTLQYTHMNEKEIPGVFANIHCKFQGLNPKVKQNRSFLVLHPSSGEDRLIL